MKTLLVSYLFFKPKRKQWKRKKYLMGKGRARACLKRGGISVEMFFFLKSCNHSNKSMDLMSEIMTSQKVAVSGTCFSLRPYQCIATDQNNNKNNKIV